MKKHLKKLSGKLRRRQDAAAPVPRITNDTLAEHREAVIAKGKRYKYPMQQTKHRTVAVSIAIVVLLVIGLAILTWFRLYRAQDTSGFFYRVTQIIPMSVASVDGEAVPYRDYLLELRSAMHYLSTKEAINFASDAGRDQLEYQKRVALNKVIEQTLVRKLARQENISVSRQEVDDFIKTQVESNQLGASEEDFRKVIKEYYDWSFDEYRQSIENQLLRRKVVFGIDDPARSRTEGILKELQGGADFAKLATEKSDDAATKKNGGDIGFIGPNSNDPDDIYEAVRGVEKGKLSKVSQGADNYFVAKVVDKRDDEIHVAHITTQLKEFPRRLKELRKNNKIEEYIAVER
ncbi:SurA N-terminal domain-containing protein [Candidatus Saccharibacteria bacterium]|nr:SurA N-terminal domain-containing protein [Candidatus Saccharibacteria bacterium]